MAISASHVIGVWFCRQSTRSQNQLPIKRRNEKCVTPPKRCMKKYVCKPRLYTSSSSLGYITELGGSTRPNAIDFYAGHEEERKRNERKAINEIATRSQTRQWETKTCQLHNSIQNNNLGRCGPALMSRCVIFLGSMLFFEWLRLTVAKVHVMHQNLKSKQCNGLFRINPSQSIFFFTKIQFIAQNFLTRKWVYGPSDKTAFAFSFCFFSDKRHASEDWMPNHSWIPFISLLSKALCRFARFLSRK